MSAGTLSEAAAIVGGRLAGDDARWQGVSTDTRTLKPGALFFALRGPHFDGAQFLAAARERGAAGAVVAGGADDPLPQIVVADPRAALGALAVHWRRRHAHGAPAAEATVEGTTGGTDREASGDTSGGTGAAATKAAGRRAAAGRAGTMGAAAIRGTTIVAVTGSNGKTTVKEMIAACLGGGTLATRGNLNNDIGVPLMLFELEPSHRYGVFELGANHPGEIAYLAGLVDPDVAVITNAGPAHLEGFGSIEGVAHAKGELFERLGAAGTAVINADDDYAALWRELAAPARIVTFGSDPGADVHPLDVRSDAQGSRFTLEIAGRERHPVRLPLPGPHNVLNACAAVAAAVAAGVPAGEAAARLANVRLPGGRLRQVAGPPGVTVYDDSYNANPASMTAAARFLVALEGEPWMVVGDMGELGAEGRELHRRLGRELRGIGIARLFAVGELSAATIEGFGGDGEYFAGLDALVAALRERLAPGVNLLVKGSRAAAMEQAVAALTRDTTGHRRQAANDSQVAPERRARTGADEGKAAAPSPGDERTGEGGEG